MNYYITVLKKYAVFSGRAQRAEYWYFFLFHFIFSIVLGIVSAAIGDNINIIIGLLYSLAVFIPGLAVMVRRLHDTNHSGWWLLALLVPLIGILGIFVLLFFLVRDSQPGLNRYGANPKEVATS